MTYPKITFFATALMFGAITTSYAGKPADLNDGEMALVPSYCADTQGFKYGNASFNPSPRANHWVSLMGPSFWDMHHYCWALLNMRRAAVTSSAQKRKGLWESAAGDIQYVIKNSAPNFVLLPEILVTLGGVCVHLSNVSCAYESFLRSRTLKPDYWPAYSDWADVLIKSSQKSEAKALVKTGLGYVPDSKILQDQFRLLGGNFADIVPLAKPKPAASEPADSVVEPEPGNANQKPPQAEPKRP